MVEKGKSIKNKTQLVTISNDCFLFSRGFLLESINQPFPLWELSKNPAKEVFIEKDGKALSELGRKGKQRILYIQKMKSIFINKKGRSHNLDYDFPKKLYLEFINKKKKEDVEDIKDFCIFPSLGEMEKLFDEYKQAGIEGVPEFAKAFNEEVPEEFKKEEEVQKEIIRKINLKFIWKKRKELKNFVDDYLNNRISYHKILWLNKQMESVSLALMDPNNFLWKQIKAGEEWESIKDDRRIEEVIGMKNINNMFLIEANRVYGHFAYCCLELFLDILDEKKIFCCKNCGQYNYIANHSDRKYCNQKENAKCYKNRKAKYSRNYRKKKTCG
ncbi:MAG: hypothetical protein U5L10_02165 [Candidatus Moranbacteria bacterium]|nr:hypothetical protein [Candidatus Moranbacteria bacterium]